MTHELLVLGLSHRTAPVSMRERLAVPGDRVPDWLTEVRGLPGLAEATLLSTCNRVEIYAATPDRVSAFASLFDHLRKQLGDDAEAGELELHLYRRHGRAAVLHLFRVAASLDSLVVGEPQILGQVKDAYELACQAGSAGAVLGNCFQRAFRVARRVRRETGIARQPVSVSSVAVDMARRVFAGFEDRRVLLVGAGKMSDLAARALRGHGATLAVTNRTRTRAEALAERLGGAKVEPFEELERAMAEADIVITSTGAQRPIITREHVARVQKRRRRRALVIVDIAVPRDVDERAADIEGVFLWDIDDLQKEASLHLSGRREEAEKAETLVEQEVVTFLQNVRGQAVGPTIKAMRERFMSIARAHAERARDRMPHLDERGRIELDRMVHALVNELLHAPQVALKKGAGEEDGPLLAGAAERLFGLEVATPSLQEPDERDGEAGAQVQPSAEAPAPALKKENTR